MTDSSAECTLVFRIWNATTRPGITRSWPLAHLKVSKWKCPLQKENVLAFLALPSRRSMADSVLVFKWTKTHVHNNNIAQWRAVHHGGRKWEYQTLVWISKARHFFQFFSILWKVASSVVKGTTSAVVMLCLEPWYNCFFKRLFSSKQNYLFKKMQGPLKIVLAPSIGIKLLSNYVD